MRLDNIVDVVPVKAGERNMPWNLKFKYTRADGSVAAEVEKKGFLIPSLRGGVDVVLFKVEDEGDVQKGDKLTVEAEYT